MTRSQGDITAKERLATIRDERWLRAFTPMGWAAEQDDPQDAAKRTQRVVCFSETPLEHVWTLIADIAGRTVQMEPYGVALPKYKARKMGVNPVWYVDMTPGRNWDIANALTAMRDAAIATGDFHAQSAARIFPFVEPMAVWEEHTREFWWEREWRHVGDVWIDELGWLFLCPEDEIEDFVPQIEGEHASDWNRRKRQFIDPRWGLERIIAHLGGIAKTDVTPFS
jgi:hypothetical protein